ncbi:glycosyltransferase [Paenibacillus sp. NPDC058177]|uniref:glycosyltransferase n=1 Tax=Paenibacillus sp. NPDC058177 TaxID=3346369 RepID=UPI0036DA99BC
MKEKRILWLLNHQTLSEFELPLIKDLGFEIFTPKIASKVILQSSGSVTYDYDDTLSIPEEDLKLLNEYDFFSLHEMPLYIKKIINTHFSIALTYTDSAFLIFKKLIHNFDGLIFFRAFGVGGTKFSNYTELLNFYFDQNDHYRLEQIRGRFYYSQCYPNLAEIEDDLYKEAAVYMPLGLPEDFYEIQDQWSGNSDKLLFFCTRIKYVAEAEEIYKQFKKDFSDFNYVIAGNQPVPVDDPRVTGFLKREELNELYKTCKVMYYHSTNPRHLHYHPLEAMIAGMPVVYMDGGLLSKLGGERQTGACKNIIEAKQKVRQILSGDQKLIREIVEDQKEILFKFSYEFVLKQWKTDFLPVVENYNTQSKEQIAQKLSIFMPSKMEKSHLNDYFNLAISFSEDVKEVSPLHSIEISTYNNENSFESGLEQLIDSKITTSNYNFKRISVEDISNSLDLMFKPSALWHSNYYIPVDYAQNYVNSDLWLFLMDDLELPIAPIKPFGIYIEDIARKFYENISPINVHNLKMAAFVLTQSRVTKNDLVKHLGLDKNKIFVVSGPRVENSLANEKIQSGDYDVIEMDIKKPQYVIDIINHLNDYFQLYKDDRQIKILFNNFSKGEDDTFLNELNKFVETSNHLSENITIHVNVRKKEYDALYAYAKKIIYPHHLKHMLFKLTKAASFSKIVIVEDLPLYKQYEKTLGNTFVYKKFINNSDSMFEILNKDELNITQKENDYSNDLFKNNTLNLERSLVWGRIL